MTYKTTVNEFFGKTIDLLKLSKTFQPKDLAKKLCQVMEENKKSLIDATYAPNIYRIYLNSRDMAEIKALLKSLTAQLKRSLKDKIKEKGYSILSGDITIEIEALESLKRNEVNINALLTDGEGAVNDKSNKTKPVADEDNDFGSADEESKQEEKTVINEEKTIIKEKPLANIEIIEGEEKGRIIEIKEGEFVFGRSSKADITLKDKELSMSRAHFKLFVSSGEILLADLDSGNGTSVNSELQKEVTLKNGDVIEAGSVKMKVRVD